MVCYPWKDEDHARQRPLRRQRFLSRGYTQRARGADRHDRQRSAASGPLELLLLALGGCTGADVISILRKKREQVTDYRVEIRGERREEHPRSFRRLELRHIVRGHGISEAAVARAVQLSTEKYCSVAATLRPTAEIVSTWEIQEEPAGCPDTSGPGES